MSKILIVAVAVCLSACACVPGNTNDHPETFLYNGKPVVVTYDSAALDEIEAYAAILYEDVPSPPVYEIVLHSRSELAERNDSPIMFQWAYTHELVHLMLLEMGRPDLSEDEVFVDKLALHLMMLQEIHEIQGFTE